MILFSVEKLASLCKVDRETIRRWRNRGVNGVKLEARQSVSQRGAALIFDEAAVRAFMEKNPKYVTKELDEFLNASHNEEYVENSKAKIEVRSGLAEGYVEKMLIAQRNDLLKKLNEIDRALELIKGKENNN